MRTTKVVTAVAAFFVALSPQASLSGPDETTSWLMNEPASLMDIGLMRGEAHLASQSYEYSFQAIIYYDWDSDNIVISQTRYPSNQADSEVDARSICSDWFRAMRQSLSVDPETGKPFLEGYRQAANWFLHDGYARGKQLDDGEALRVEIAGKIRLQFFISFKEKGEMKSLKCKGELEASGFTFEVS